LNFPPKADDKAQQLIDEGTINHNMRGKHVKALTSKILDRVPGIFDGLVKIMDEFPNPDRLVSDLRHLFVEKDDEAPFQWMKRAPDWFG
jgi:hypothetical protein